MFACRSRKDTIEQHRSAGGGLLTALQIRVYLIDKLKISEVGDKREYRIYRNFIGDRENFSDKI